MFNDSPTLTTSGLWTQSVANVLQTDFEMVGSSNHLRVTWQFFSGTVNSQETYDLTNGREFKYDKNFLDHFMVAISPVS